MAFRSFRFPLVTATLALLVAAVPAAAQTYNHFPGSADTNDGRTVALAGSQIETLAQDSMTFIIAVPPGESTFELGIFDGDTGRTGADGFRHWDNGTTSLRYSLFFDSLQQGSTDPGDLVGTWEGNSTTNPTSDPMGQWVASGPSFPDNGWWNLTVNVPIPPEPQPGQAPSGATFYHLCVSYSAQTGSGLPDPCTGAARPIDSSPATISNFKLRATANIAVLSFAFAYEGALRFTNRDPFVIYPEYAGVPPTPGSNYWLTTPTTYDGSWSFNLDVETSQERLEIFGGDFDFGNVNLVGFPSGTPIQPCIDTDDPDTPNSADFPPFAADNGTRLDDSLPEGARVSGSPADDNSPDVFRRSPCINWTLTSPGPDGDILTLGDNVVYVNDNPSSQREWELFSVSAEPTCDSSDLCNPLLGNCADYCEDELLPAGVWRVDVNGVDLSNLNAWRSSQLNSFCLNCELLPRPYLVGDTVFEDTDGDGVQEAGEPGITGVLVELLDDNGSVIDTRRTGDGSVGYGAGEWEACQERNTGGGNVVDTAGLYCFDVSVPNDDPDNPDSEQYSVRVAEENFATGGALYGYFGTEPEATTESPVQTNSVTEGGGNVMTYDFGYRVVVVLGSLGDRVWLDADGDGVQDDGEAGINGVTVNLYDGNGDLVATTTTAGDGEYLFADLEPGTYTVAVDASTLPPGLAATYDLDGLETAHEATVELESGQDRRDVDFGYTPCGECEGKVSRLTLQYLGDEAALVEVYGRRGPIKDDPLFAGVVQPGGTFELVGPATGNGGFTGTLGTEISLFVDGTHEAMLHTSCSQPIGPGTVAGPFVVVAGASKQGGALCPTTGGTGGGGDDDDDGGDDDNGDAPGTGTIGYWKNHAEAWPVTSLTLGDRVYTQAEALALLGRSVKGDITIQLAQQLIAAKLNVALGNPSSCIDATIAAADDYLAAHPPGSKPKGATKNQGEALKNTLDEYNNGRLCAPHRG